jgi:hypothetical protein
LASQGLKKYSGSSLSGVIRQTLLRAREGHLPVLRQVVEMLVLKLCYGLGPGHYHTARYWRRELPWDFKAGYWTYKKYHNYLCRINDPLYYKISQNKIPEKAVLQLFNIPGTAFIGHLHREHGLLATGAPLRGSSDLEAWLLAHPGCERLCFKLVEGSGGEGFQAVRCRRDKGLTFELLDGGAVVSVEYFLAEILQQDAFDYIVEEYVMQHPELALLNPSSVNTLRVWVGGRGDQYSVMGVFLRVGRQGSLVDNTSRGGQIFPVNIDTGRIGQGMEKTIFNGVFDCHKDSGLNITGRTLPFWADTLALARQALSIFPRINFAGVDIAITASGPVLIELNVEPDPTAAIIFDRSHAQLFSDMF